MKMKAEDFDALRDLVKQYPLQATREQYAKHFLSERRWVFDHLWNIPQAERDRWFARGIYTYLNDDHIYTALKAITQKLH